MSNSSDKKNTYTYADAGVSIDAGNAVVEQIKPLVKATARPGADAELGGFGGLFDLKAAGFKDPILVAANDGVGTKLKIAIESGKHDTVGIDLVAMCVNDLIVQGAEPLFFLDYLATGKLDEEQAANIVKGIAIGCQMAGAALIGGETAEMPGMYTGGDYDLAGFCVGAAERGTLLPHLDQMKPGDKLLGLASSGVHSNGYSLVRRLVADNGLSWNEKAPFDGTKTLGEALLEPTKIYVKPVLNALKGSDGIKALAHITGGGLTENIPRVLSETQAVEIDLSAWTLPPVFKWLSQVGGMETSELVRTFNCGVGMVLVVEADKAGEVSALLSDAGESVFEVGELIERDGEQVIYKGILG